MIKGLHFLNCIKKMILEKMEDLQDIRAIKQIREGSKQDYLSAGEIDPLF